MKKVAAGLLLLVLSLPLAADAGVSSPSLISGAQLYGRNDDEFAAALVVDAATGNRLYAYQADKKWPAASLTKLMTALVSMDHHPSWQSLVSIRSQDEVGGGRLRVPIGATMTARDLLYSAIVASANNAAMALARVSGLGVKTFVKKMNQKAASLGMDGSSFVEPSGMDPKNTLTAWDAYRLASKAFSMPDIRRPASTMSYNFRIRNTYEIKKLTNTNNLLTLDPDVWVLGGKTGFLYESRYNLIVKIRAYPLSPSKPALYVIVFGSPTKEASFDTAKSLANWAYKAYTWQSS